MRQFSTISPNFSLKPRKSDFHLIRNVSGRPFKILFLCTSNSTRSIIAEYVIRQIDPYRFQSYSAGTKPTGRVNPYVLHILKENFRIDASDARSKSWDEFKDVMFDFVIAICDDAKENCPIWSGQPVVAHWSYPDPSDFEGTEEEKLRQIAQVTAQIRRRLDLFCALPLEKMEKNNLEYAVTSMGKGTLNGKRE